MIPRLIQNRLAVDLAAEPKTILMLGARQVGKTTLLKTIEKNLATDNKRILYLNCDLDEQREVVNTTSLGLLKQLLQNVDVLFIDEAQRLNNPGLTLKIIHDVFPQVKVLTTGSSSFELKNKISDPMTGRIIDFTLYPLSLLEVLYVQSQRSPLFIKKQAEAILPSVLTYGLYPAVYTENDPIKKRNLLLELAENYLFKDVLMFERIRNSQAIKDLTRALAYQIGSEVNENELASRLSIDRKTVRSYIEILEKTFVLIRVFPYSKNPRREIGKNYKVYFVDLGIRNALIGDFNSPFIRSDLGFLWENFLFIERMKFYANNNERVLNYNFWRSYSGAEVDYIEKPISKEIRAYEFKYSSKAVSRGAFSFTKTYHTPVNLINKDNFFDFISGKS